MASHPLDLQCFPEEPEGHITVAHVGPPACNVEIKLVGVLDTSVEKGGDPAGDVGIVFWWLCSTDDDDDVGSGAGTVSRSAAGMFGGRWRGMGGDGGEGAGADERDVQSLMVVSRMEIERST